MYVGHTDDQGNRQLLIDHLQGVEELSGSFAAAFNMAGVGKLIGRLHDVGKYSQQAQRRMLEDGPKVDHSTAGGQLLVKHYGKNLFTLLCAYCIMGHHSGLMDGGSEADVKHSMYARLKKDGIDDYAAYKGELSLRDINWPDFKPLKEIGYGFSLSFLGRMLYSCLVDADYLDTEAFMSGPAPRGAYDDIEHLAGLMDKVVEKLSNPTTPINKKRTEILQQCRSAAKRPRGIYTLTVPTGGGKTISSLSFALKHACAQGMSRVIYVIPYTSIIEQNAEVFKDILGEKNVLEHHSNVLYDNEEDEAYRKHLAAENWDCPVVVTTNVQFFESLFANRSSKCRKLHNIANSVIIFDEAQMLPLPYLRACTKAIGELVYNYGCTAVLCTATQSSLDSFFPQELIRGEICDDPKALYEYFRRTSIVDIGELTMDELVQRLHGAEQVLCIVNTKREAQEAYRALEGEGCYHLSTAMYPQHRRKVLNEIRARLKAGQPCRVVSTSLVEAGVDLDFPVVYRARAGLDSVIQAAGRCNREGKRKAEESMVYVFSTPRQLPKSMRTAAEAFNEVARKHEDISSLEAIRAYFEQLRYFIGQQGLDKKDILEQLEQEWRACSFAYKKLANEFKLIEEETYSVFIPLRDDSDAQTLLERIRQGERSRALMREVGQFSVNVRRRHLDELLSMGMVECMDENDAGLFILTDQNAYDQSIGLKLEAEAGFGVFI